MSLYEAGPETQRAEGRLFTTVRRLLATVVSIVHTRVELLTTELQEEIHRAAAILLWSLVALFFASLGVLMLALTLLIAFWDGPRLLVAGLICAAFFVTALATGLWVRRLIRSRSGLLAGSLAELRRDREALERLP